ncbi:MAG TPA: shikimate kinase [Acidobacteriaceae bacterium]|nr:shikimate kinase [Acidobacteriaceae bacterium]
MAKATQEILSRAEFPRPVSRIVLTGFMGAGKSTVGGLLAEALGWRFLDLDCVIEAECRKSVAEIFRDHGESYFRERERQALQQLAGERNLVLALGGGAVEDPSSLAALLTSADTCLVFLDAPLSALLSRVQGASGTRPLLTTQEDLHARLERRLPLYRSAHLTVETTDLAARQVAERVIEHVSKDWQIPGAVKSRQA